MGHQGVLRFYQEVSLVPKNISGILKWFPRAFYGVSEALSGGHKKALLGFLWASGGFQSVSRNF